MIATAKALAGQTKITGRLPVSVNASLKAGAGIDLCTANDSEGNKMQKIKTVIE